MQKYAKILGARLIHLDGQLFYNPVIKTIKDIPLKLYFVNPFLKHDEINDATSTKIRFRACVDSVIFSSHSLHLLHP